MKAFVLGQLVPGLLLVLAIAVLLFGRRRRASSRETSHRG